MPSGELWLRCTKVWESISASCSGTDRACQSDLSADALAIAIADEGAVAALIRRPKFDTILNLWVSGRIDLRNGSLFDLVARRPKVRTKDFLRAIEKRMILSVAAKFLLVPRGGPWPLERDPQGSCLPTAARAPTGKMSNTITTCRTLSTALFLDPDMVYTCGYFADWADDLATAQRNKLDMSCRRLRLKPGETLLDIGCGWGAFICHAAQHYGVRAHGVTLAQKQYDYAKEKIARLGLQDRVTLELRDYALVDGSFDKIASIGMFEQVGIDNHPTYFQTVNRLLKPDGLYLHHAISRPAKGDDKGFSQKNPAIYRNHAVYISRRRSRSSRHGDRRLESVWISKFTTLKVGASIMRGPAASGTIACWRINPQPKTKSVREKTRLWLAYLAGCSIGFERNGIGIFQTLASKRKRGPSGLPPTRADLYRDQVQISRNPRRANASAR